MKIMVTFGSGGWCMLLISVLRRHSQLGLWIWDRGNRETLSPKKERKEKRKEANDQKGTYPRTSPLREAKAGAEAEAIEDCCLAGLVLKAGCSFVRPRTTCLVVTPSTVSRTLPHQSLIKEKSVPKPDLRYIFSIRFLLPNNSMSH